MNALQTVAEFCADNRVSRATLYRLVQRGIGPRIIKIGKATRISADAAAEWRQSLQETGDTR